MAAVTAAVANMKIATCRRSRLFGVVVLCMKFSSGWPGNLSNLWLEKEEGSSEGRLMGGGGRERDRERGMQKECAEEEERGKIEMERRRWKGK